MENNFENTLDNLATKNKGKFVGLLRRNGVIINPNVGLEGLKNVLGNAMAKSKTFRDEIYLLMATLILSNSDENFANTTGMFKPMDFGADIFGTTGTANNSGSTSTTSTINTTKKPFEETLFGKITNTIGSWGNIWLESQEAKRDEQIAKAEIVSSTTPIKLPPQTQKRKTGLYVGLGLAGVAVVGVIIYFANKK